MATPRTNPTYAQYIIPSVLPAVAHPTAVSSVPSLSTRSVGQHAASFGFDWHKRADHHKYILKSGLPELHAAMLNDDWAYAQEILCVEDIGLTWVPVVSQRQTQAGQNTPDLECWPASLPSTDKTKQQHAIIAMATQLHEATSVAPAGCLYGTNLITLCLHLTAPADFTARVIDMAAKHARQYLDLPDASGRTPLYVAIERKHVQQVTWLLDAGADPFVGCSFRGSESPCAYDLALNEGPNEIFDVLLRALISKNPDMSYPIQQDPLNLRIWAARHDEETVRALAQRFSALRDALFNYPDKSGTSLVYRHIKEKKSAQIAGVTVSPLGGQPLEKTSLYAAATCGSVTAYIELLKYTNKNFAYNDKSASDMKATVAAFFQVRNVEDIIAILNESTEMEQVVWDVLLEELTQRNSLSMEKFLAIAHSLWPRLDDQQKRSVLVNTARYPEPCLNAILQILDCSLDNDSIYYLRDVANKYKNKAAWEFAADRCTRLGHSLHMLKARKGENVPTYIVEEILNNGSLRWFDAFLNAGMPLQGHIDHAGMKLLPLLADLDPSGLAKRLTDTKLPASKLMLENCMSEAGKQALRALMSQE